MLRAQGFELRVLQSVACGTVYVFLSRSRGRLTKCCQTVMNDARMQVISVATETMNCMMMARKSREVSKKCTRPWFHSAPGVLSNAKLAVRKWKPLGFPNRSSSCEGLQVTVVFQGMSGYLLSRVAKRWSEARKVV